MKIFQKYLYLVFFSVVLLFIAVYGASKADTSLPCFLVQSPNEATAKRLFIYDSNDGNYYVFLPSYADMEHVTVSFSSKQFVSLDGVSLSDGMDCGDFELEKPYDFEINEQQIATLWFYKSENVGTMYIETATGSMEHIHKDKNYEENASFTLYTMDGVINYSDEKSILKGRGNATWKYDKHPYTLTLSTDGDLLGMGAATNWVLLANASDETNLNNKLIFDLASRVGFEWSPESKWVDVYLNGEYNGLYLLTEKVEVNENRLNIDTSSGDFLCKIDLNERWETLRNPFLTEAGRTVEISYPEILSKEKAEGTEHLVNRMEQTILSGTDLRASEIIDLDSWIRRYLIDEISGNIDSDLGSSYFYYSDGVFYAGPIWDYDMSLGNSNRNQQACSFIAKNAQKSDSFLSPYYSSLYANESFYNRMIEIYSTEFLPVLQQMINGEIDSLIATINKASQMNSLRWRPMYDSLQNWNHDAVCTTTELITYLERRIAFLNSAWLENKDYCTVQFEFFDGGSYWNISVEKGSCLETSYVDFNSTVWVDSETGTVIDFSEPITTDMIVTQQTISNSDSEPVLATKDYIVFLSIAVLLIILLGLAIIDVSHRFKERRAVDERNRTKISS